jgi:hypothetical protein
VHLSSEDGNKCSLRDLCGLKETGVMDAVQNIREKDSSLVDVAETFMTPVALVLFIDTWQL